MPDSQDEAGKRRRMADGLVFTVNNHHHEGCGTPPAIDGNVPGRYHGYFESEYGEQAVFVYDHESGEATVRLGDAGWGTVTPVVDGRAVGLLLTQAEAAWLHACWLACEPRRGRGKQADDST